MNNEFFDALELIEKEKGVTVEYLIEKIKAAIEIAVRKQCGAANEVVVTLDPATRAYKIAVKKEVVLEVTDPANQILLSEAQKISKRVLPGAMVDVKLDPKKFGRIAAQAAKHVIRQGIREGEKGMLLQKYNEKLHQIVLGKVVKIDPTNGNVIVEVDKTESVLFANEQIPGEVIQVGDNIKMYVSDIISSEKRCSMKLSRTHKDFVKKLFENEVPEIAEGIVEIKSVSREAGSRSKVAVYSADENVDAVGACIGANCARIESIVEELGGEKIEIVKWSEDPAVFIANALAPAKAHSVEIIDEEAKQAMAKVPEMQLSLAIGNKGQNAKLAARLTGFKIDIRPESGYYGEE